MRYLYLSVLFLFIANTNTSGQKILQLERFGSLKVKKYYIGDVLTFQLKGEGKTWFTEGIENIFQEEGLIHFARRVVKVEDIISIRSYEVQRWSKPIAKNLVRFGITWGVFSVLGTLVSFPLTWTAAIVPAVSFAVAGLIRVLFRHRTYKIGKKRRLRLLDMDRDSFFNPGRMGP